MAKRLIGPRCRLGWWVHGRSRHEGGDRRRGWGSFGVNLGRPTVTNGDGDVLLCSYGLRGLLYYYFLFLFPFIRQRHNTCGCVCVCVCVCQGTSTAGGEYRLNCFELSTVDGSVHCLSIETRQELLRLEKAWHKATYVAVKHLAVSVVCVQLELR